MKPQIGEGDIAVLIWSHLPLFATILSVHLDMDLGKDSIGQTSSAICQSPSGSDGAIDRARNGPLACSERGFTGSQDRRGKIRAGCWWARTSGLRPGRMRWLTPVPEP